MSWSGDQVSENFKLYERKMKLYFDDEGITDKEKQARKVLRSIGDEGLRLLDGSDLSEDDQKDPDKLLKFFKEQLPKNEVNFRIHRLQFMRFHIRQNESIDNFVTRLRTYAAKCDFEEAELHERIIELCIASTPSDDFRKELLTKDKGFKTKDVLELGRKYETLAQGTEQLKQLHIADTPTGEGVEAIRHNRQRKCTYCGTIHKKRACPAYKSECDVCGRIGHWGAVCRTKKQNDKDHKKEGRSKSRGRSRHRSRSRKKSGQKNVQSIEQEEDVYEALLDTITVSANVDNINRREVFTTLAMKPPAANEKIYQIRLKIDTGSSVNTLPLRTMRQIYTHDTQIKKVMYEEAVRLTAYNGKKITYLGSVDMQLKHENRWYATKFLVVDVDEEGYKLSPIIGLPSCEKMKLVQINSCDVDTITPAKQLNSVEDLKKIYPDQFDTIGNFEGSVRLHLKDNAEPYVAAPRRCSVHMRDKVREALDDMEKKGIIRKINEHTDWCSNVCFVTKKDGSLRVCLDPKRLNDNLKRCPHKIPTVEELNPMFTGATHFSKLDAKAGYWACKLEEKSQLLTTFRSPLGQRYCFQRMPFGLNVSQDEFQKAQDMNLEGLEGVVGIADDVCVMGRTEEEHDRNLIALMDRAVQKGLVFNSQKCLIKQKKIEFFGNIYSAEGVMPDPKKVRDIQQMPAPTNKEEVHTFLGMLTYLSQYISKFSDKTAVLRDLLKKDSLWCWDEVHQQAFEALKTQVTCESTLCYFDVNKPVTLEVDASMKGLGAAIIQENKPIAFGSKALTDTQSRYSNIEREMLAIVFGCERYHTLLYGKEFTVVTDHKPLVTICHKPIHSAPARLQRMLLRIQGYNFTIKYRPGAQMILADALSRLPSAENRGDVDLDLRIDDVTIQIESDKLRDICMINFTADRRESIARETANDPALNALKEVIYAGWPDNIKELASQLRPYWAYRDELAIEGGVIFKGRQVVIPPPLRDGILAKLHQGHQGIEKTRRLCRESCYWPNINKDVEKICTSCQLCQEFQHRNKPEPMIAYEIPSKKWQYIASDLFQIGDTHFLIIADKYSKFPIVEEMTIPITSHAVVAIFKRYCAIFGKPQTVYSDNGPQFAGEAFKKFTADWGINHVTISPTYSQSNGFIERQIGHIKPLITKAMRNNEDIQLLLLNLRATPIDSKLPSPAELLLGEPIATLLPSRHSVGREFDRDALHERREKMLREDREKGEKRQLPPLIPGQFVRILSNRNHRWFPGTVIGPGSTPRTYKVRSSNRVLRRNRVHLRSASEEPSAAAPTVKQPPTPTPPTPKAPKIELEPRRLFKDEGVKKKVTFAEKPEVKVIPTQKPEVKANPVKKPTPSNENEKAVTTRSGRVIKPNIKYQ